ncbi:MAG: hypothetical protein AAF650_05890 [Pseudomonadota bacterium]
MAFRRVGADAQGEVKIYLLEGEMPSGLIPLNDQDRLGRPIIGHSESGSHHVLERAVKVFEEPNPPRGMRVLYALLDEPTALLQDDPSHPHEAQTLPMGLYEFRIKREHESFTEQARMVAD